MKASLPYESVAATLLDVRLSENVSPILRKDQTSISPTIQSPTKLTKRNTIDLSTKLTSLPNFEAQTLKDLINAPFVMDKKDPDFELSHF